ncbi:MAG: TrmH family RNA methyltransferase [Betaproteobacteria bacterium]
MKRITSDANPSYRRWLKLATQPRAARELGASLAEGEHLALAVLGAGVPIEAALARAGSGNHRLLACLPAQVPLFELSAALFDRLGLVERGIGFAVVFAVPPEAPGPVAGDLVYLDGVQDPGNTGALLRVAAAAGVTDVWAATGGAALWSPKVLRAAQGAHFALRLRESLDVNALQRDFRGTRVATVLEDALPLWTAPLPNTPVAWLIGSEGRGLSMAAGAVADMRVRIPLAAGVESLNVASAAAVCLFERQRRRTV